MTQTQAADRVACRDCQSWLWRDDVRQHNESWLTVCLASKDPEYGCPNGRRVEAEAAKQEVIGG